MKAQYKPYTLNFKRASGTSRGVLHTKDTYLLKLEMNGEIGYGECALFRGLSIDDRPDYEDKLQWLVEHIHLAPELLYQELMEFPSIQFGLETAIRSLRSSNPFEVFDSPFFKGHIPIPINGLVWMGDFQFMKTQIEEKINQGFQCIKLKIGAIDFDEELALLKSIRREFSADDIELRVDANGAFKPEKALEKLKQLSAFELHSIEQPITPKQWQAMAQLCLDSPLDIALDEELIGVFSNTDKMELLSNIQPQYIILKPALVGGFTGSESWISAAEDLGIKWWITSALESNIGLNAIAQWTSSLETTAVQGLGTGELFTNNFKSPLLVKNGTLHYQSGNDWQFKF